MLTLNSRILTLNFHILTLNYHILILISHVQAEYKYEYHMSTDQDQVQMDHAQEMIMKLRQEVCSHHLRCH
jgi:hypothetical protein